VIVTFRCDGIAKGRCGINDTGDVPAPSDVWRLVGGALPLLNVETSAASRGLVAPTRFVVQLNGYSVTLPITFEAILPVYRSLEGGQLSFTDSCPMETQVEFRSDRFPPYDGEEGVVNPGRYGKRLAEFLQLGLWAKGFEAGDPVAEDWGWIVPIKNDAFPLWIGCGNYDEYPDDGFLCFIEPHTPTIRKFVRRIDVSPIVGKLRVAIDELLDAQPGVRDKRWWTFEEFNHPGQTGR
jgi:hypothetical protein